MTLTSKFCDAADWFRPEVHEVITNELREIPRFHRKQWESAMIFLALRQAGKLRPESRGLSMGGGRELILYAIAPHVQRLTVTDLYEVGTAWECANTSDPEVFIKQHKPFPVDDSRLTALRMDMRQLDFPDASFDFCYSTCAVEHIGQREDFVRHFNEVARVLKDDGVYVFTTEVSYGSDTIKDFHNYVFSLEDLHDMFAESNLFPQEEFDARIAHHKINHPTPSNLKSLSHFIPELFTEHLLQESPHIQLMRGKHPFTCGIFVMTKRQGNPIQPVTRFVGLEDSRTFVESGVEQYRSLLQRSGVSIDPFSLLPGEKSRYFADHMEFVGSDGRVALDHETVFHTDYFWLGSGERVFDLSLGPVNPEGDCLGEIEVRVHRFKTLDSRTVECELSTTVDIDGPGMFVRRVELEMDEESNYAVLAKYRKGAVLFKNIVISSYPASLAKTIVLSGSSDLGIRCQFKQE